MLITIAMAVRNGARTIQQAVRSILRQTYDDWELIVVDDGSKDDSAAIIDSLDDPRIRVLRNSRSEGLAACLNRAIEEAKGQLFARLDVDDVAYPDRFERQLAFLQDEPRVDLLGSRMMVFRDDGTPVGSPKSCFSHEALCATPWRGFYLPHPTWTGRMEWFRRHRYDPRFLKAQDHELLLRVFRESRYACLDEILVGYRQHKIELIKMLKTRYYVSRALLAHGHREHLYGRAALAVCAQGAKVIADTVAVSTGLEGRLLRHRALPVSQEEVERWHTIWRGVTGVDH